MFNQLKTETINLFLLIGVALLVLEFTLHDGGTVFFLLVTIAGIYFGRKKMPRTKGKILFWSGIFFFTLTLLNTAAFKFLLIAILVYTIYKYIQNQKNPKVIKPEQPIVLEKKEDHGMVIEAPLMKNILFGTQQTPEEVYEWKDINIQTGVGDTVIDLTNTVLPKGEAVIFIRGFIGNIQIFIPYDAEVSLKHSVAAGAVNVLDYQEPRKLNCTINLQTEGYLEAKEKIKICTSLLTGDLEVRRK
ncbi:cell wall-active antibiotics response protein [Bacillus mangrovi]|uniref:Cell wall-active antibiotics response protein n=1 Tax=Metabacillus mangrovi TaxID=1491830 RepID=A0A7X2V380_9BACI|nr:cell wall-active antibiotics response protein [Metabacillus mangrovi]